MIKQDILEKQAKVAYIAIGSNLGNKKKNILATKKLLKEKKIRIIRSSKNYVTLSWPNKNKPKFINAVLKIKTTFSPLDLLKRCLKIENQLGRIRKRRNEPRICDIDIIDYNGEIIQNSTRKSLILPHSEMHKRSFVLIPLFEICKTWTHPLKKITIKSLIKTLKKEDIRSVKLI